MRRFQFSLLGMFGFMTVAAMGCAALVHPSPLWCSAVAVFVMLALLNAIVGAVLRRGPARRFWVGFLVFGWGSLALLFGGTLITINSPNPSYYPSSIFLDSPLNWLYEVTHKNSATYAPPSYTTPYATPSVGYAVPLSPNPANTPAPTAQVAFDPYSSTPPPAQPAAEATTSQPAPEAAADQPPPDSSAPGNPLAAVPAPEAQTSPATSPPTPSSNSVSPTDPTASPYVPSSYAPSYAVISGTVAVPPTIAFVSPLDPMAFSYFKITGNLLFVTLFALLGGMFAKAFYATAEGGGGS
jgi:hypothetical protein